MRHFSRHATPLGQVLLVSTDNALAGVWLEGQTCFADPGARTLRAQSSVPVLRQTQKWLDSYFAGERPGISELPLAPAGSAFRQAVWDLLCHIPYGETRTYGDLARDMAAALGKPRMSAQAIGGAVGHNPISIIIPCHRVVGAGGKLTGYAGGLDKKRFLLLHEGAYSPAFPAPRNARL